MSYEEHDRIKIKTVQTSAIKTTFECLKNILPDATLSFTKKHIKLSSTNSTCTIFVFMKLNKESFEYYHVTEKTDIAVRMINLYKPIKTIVNQDILTLIANDSNKLKLKIENSEKDKIFNYELDLIEKNDETNDLMDIKYDISITMPSTEFQKVCKDFSSLEMENIEIICVEDKQLSFKGKSDNGRSEIIFGSRDDKISYIKNKDSSNIIQGKFKLKHLELITKCTNLCSSIQLCLANNKPLTIIFTIGNLGTLKFVLSPLANDD